MIAIGKEYLRTQIVYTPPKLERNEQYYGTNYTCPQCKKTEDPYFVKDKGIPALLEGSYVSESLLAYIIYRKFELYIPLYRQEKDFEQQSATIGRTSMAHWVTLSSKLYMQVMYNYFQRLIRKRRFLMMMDETLVQVLKEEDRTLQPKSYFWVICTGEDGLIPIILYHFTATRAGANAEACLKDIDPGFYLMVDGYQV